MMLEREIGQTVLGGRWVVVAVLPRTQGWLCVDAEVEGSSYVMFVGLEEEQEYLQAQEKLQQLNLFDSIGELV
jgi:hypothetical protein